VGSAAALLVTMLAARELRRYVLPAVVGVALLIGGLLVSVPAIAGQAERRAGTERTVWERDALNTAAINMYEERPLFGFGWGRYIEISDGYMEQADDYPLIKLTGITVHNVFLSHLSELGLVGLTLWVAILVAAVAGAFTTRGPPELRPWRIGLLGVVVCWLVVAMLVNPLSFPMLILFVWAGVATGLPEPQAEGAAATEPGSLSPRVGAVAAP
jgi:O-antigen ligase